MLRCRDGRYYVGSARDSLKHRLAEHDAGVHDDFTKSRRPVTPVFSQEFQRITDAIEAERQLKGWGCAKKEALIRSDYAAISRLARNRTQFPRPSTSSG